MNYLGLMVIVLNIDECVVNYISNESTNSGCALEISAHMKASQLRPEFE